MLLPLVKLWASTAAATLQVQPRNYLLLACHVFNEVAQLNQMRRALEYQSVKAKEEAAAAGAEAPVGVLEDPVKLAGGALVGAAVLGTVAVNNKIKSSLLKSGCRPAHCRWRCHRHVSQTSVTLPFIRRNDSVARTCVGQCAGCYD